MTVAGARGAPGDLAASFRRLIERHGPMPVARYMGESNARYYASRDPLGRAGDFTTAPEISQMFGELIGAALADWWHRGGRPACHYVELGPGRGTLAADALRVMAAQGLVPPVHFVEGSPALRARQQGVVPVFHDTPDTLPEDGTLLIVANEFFDALPIRQLVRAEDGWRERMVALDESGFVFAAGPGGLDALVPEAWQGAPVGTVVETAPAAAAIMDALADRLARQGGVLLAIDYGHLEPRTGETLQAVRGHARIGVFAAPGEADLTAHVDFAALAERARKRGLRVQTGTQGAFLAALGLAERTAALTRRSPARGAEFAAAAARLADAGQMGDLFKVMAVTPHGAPPLAGLAETGENDAYPLPE